MAINPVDEWRRLTEHYREMSDGELYELEADFGGLTETAQQVLRDELKLRGLDRPQAGTQANPAARPDSRNWDLVQDSPQIVENFAETEDDDASDDESREFTWKTVLCECESVEEAGQLRAALRRAGIDSWVEGRSRDLIYPRVVVAADQLEQAQMIAAQPIPQEIIDEFNAPPEEFKLPACPKCGAEDPLLESVDPVNSWLCESCGEQWSDPAEATA